MGRPGQTDVCRDRPYAAPVVATPGGFPAPDRRTFQTADCGEQLPPFLAAPTCSTVTRFSGGPFRQAGLEDKSEAAGERTPDGF